MREKGDAPQKPTGDNGGAFVWGNTTERNSHDDRFVMGGAEGQVQKRRKDEASGITQKELEKGVLFK